MLRVNMSTSATVQVSPSTFWLSINCSGDPDLDRALTNATAVIRRALPPFTVYKPPGILRIHRESYRESFIALVPTGKGLPPIDILRRMFMDKTDQQLLEMDKETVSLEVYGALKSFPSVD